MHKKRSAHLPVVVFTGCILCLFALGEVNNCIMDMDRRKRKDISKEAGHALYIIINTGAFPDVSKNMQPYAAKAAKKDRNIFGRCPGKRRPDGRRSGEVPEKSKKACQVFPYESRE